MLSYRKGLRAAEIRALARAEANETTLTHGTPEGSIQDPFSPRQAGIIPRGSKISNNLEHAMDEQSIGKSKTSLKYKLALSK